MINHKKEVINKIIITVLVLAALGLGAAIYKKNNPDWPGSWMAEDANSPAKSGEDAELSALFNTPGKNATREELDAFSALVAQNATPGDTIIVKDCTASPVVLKINYGDTFTVKNVGKTDIHFGFDAERTLVKAGASAKITAKYSHGPGIYGYGCDDPTLSRSIGLLLITQ